MSERIKELLDQCKFEKHNGPPWFEYDQEKFAELVITECCQAIERRYKYNKGTPMSFWEMSQDVQDLLKEHFGVKE